MKHEWSSFKTLCNNKLLLMQMDESPARYALYAMDGALKYYCSIAKETPASADQTDFETNYKSKANKKIGGGEPQPFAVPSYQTKHDAINEVKTIAPGASLEINYQMTAERFISGGSLCIKNAEIGDYLVAEVKDVDGVLPEAVRPYVCEAWPTVVRYVVKKFVDVQGVYSVMEISTHPLTAKIPAGLYMSIVYHAVNEGSDRKFTLNYHLTKKL